MKTKAELERDIINITIKMQREFPELSKYIAEMPSFFEGQEDSYLRTKNFIEYYNSLEQILKEYSKTHETVDDSRKENDVTLAGYPMYAPSDDIYNRAIQVVDVNLNDLSKNRSPNEEAETMNEKDFVDDMSGGDLDVPGSELDDQQENVGSEDEENNYYSLGGDNHNNLDEDKG
jgi:hypothetical protein